MANIKFSAFTQKAVTGNVDFLVGYTGADNVRISPAIFSDTYLPLAGGTMTGVLGVVVPDDFKWNFGTGSDLEIYHDGSHSYISEQGTGRLIIKSDYFEIDNAAGTEAMLEAIQDGAVNLYYNGVKTFETIATGIAVTGDVGIGTASPTTMLHLDQASNDRAGGLYIERNGSNYGLSMFVNAGGYGIIGSNGDYTTDILTLDLNGGNVGIGTDSPLAKLEVAGANQPTGGARTTYGNLLVSSTDAYGADIGGSIGLGGSGNGAAGTNIYTFSKIKVIHSLK